MHPISAKYVNEFKTVLSSAVARTHMRTTKFFDYVSMYNLLLFPNLLYVSYLYI